MADDNTVYSFDPNLFVLQLLTDLGMGHETPEATAELRAMINKQMSEIVLTTVASQVEPEILDEVMLELKDESDPETVVTQLIARSPDTQIAVLDALENFYQQTVSLRHSEQSEESPQ